jgi:hypothetical protein
MCQYTQNQDNGEEWLLMSPLVALDISGGLLTQNQYFHQLVNTQNYKRNTVPQSTAAKRDQQ